MFIFNGGTKNVSLCNATDNPTLTQLGSGQVTFNGNVDAVNGLDVSGGNTTTTGGTVTFTTTDADNCFIVRAAGNEELISCRYDSGNENITLCNATDNPTLTQLGSGQVTFNGNVDADMVWMLVVQPLTGHKSSNYSNNCIVLHLLVMLTLTLVWIVVILRRRR